MNLKILLLILNYISINSYAVSKNEYIKSEAKRLKYKTNIKLIRNIARFLIVLCILALVFDLYRFTIELAKCKSYYNIKRHYDSKGNPNRIYICNTCCSKANYDYKATEYDKEYYCPKCYYKFISLSIGFSILAIFSPILFFYFKNTSINNKLKRKLLKEYRVSESKVIRQLSVKQDIPSISALFAKDCKPQSIMFAGVTGCGKTTIADELRSYIQLQEKSCIINCNELATAESLNVLKKILSKLEPNLIECIVFDELDKAHSSIIKFLLQVIDSGNFDGRSIRNKIIIIITNTGQEIWYNNPDTPLDEIHKKVLSALEAKFSVEFMARLTKTYLLDYIDLATLQDSEIEIIFADLINSIKNEYGINLQLNASAIGNFDSKFGIRKVKEGLSFEVKKLLNNSRVLRDNTYKVSFKDGRYFLDIIHAHNTVDNNNAKKKTKKNKKSKKQNTRKEKKQNSISN